MKKQRASSVHATRKTQGAQIDKQQQAFVEGALKLSPQKQEKLVRQMQTLKCLRIVRNSKGKCGDEIQSKRQAGDVITEFWTSKKFIVTKNRGAFILVRSASGDALEVLRATNKTQAGKQVHDMVMHLSTRQTR